MIVANRYFVLRHGESEANRQGLIISFPANGTTAYVLTPRGREQMAASIDRARNDGEPARVDLVLTSPFLRARQSAEIAAGLLGAPVELDDRLRERNFGELERTADAHYARVWARDREDPAHTDWGVESAAAVQRRALDLIHELERVSDRTILLCTHGDVASILIGAFLDADLRLHRDVGALGLAEIRGLPTAGVGGARVQ